MPLGGGIGTLSLLTTVTDSFPVLLPSGKVTDPAMTSNANPGTFASSR